ncbi:hypothetical protein D1BOALGB6SA_2101 [Olavius sp. associated proteobacterium Delta 1]|nr:hypothetical protein D1BOALGB6SA_2101 [Olavius sp. associated proteobacterium Delta 1]
MNKFLPERTKKLIIFHISSKAYTTSDDIHYVNFLKVSMN